MVGGGKYYFVRRVKFLGDSEQRFNGGVGRWPGEGRQLI